MYSKSEFKRRELEFELRDEGNKPTKVFIDGKYWKTMGLNKALSSASKLGAKGKLVEFEDA